MTIFKLPKALALLPAALLAFCLAGSPQPAQAGLSDTAWTAARTARKGQMRNKSRLRRICRISRSGIRRCTLQRVGAPEKASRRAAKRSQRPAYVPIQRPAYAPTYRPAYAPPVYRPAYSPPAYSPPAYRPPSYSPAPARVFGAPTGTSQRFYRR